MIDSARAAEIQRQKQPLTFPEATKQGMCGNGGKWQLIVDEVPKPQLSVKVRMLKDDYGSLTGTKVERFEKDKKYKLTESLAKVFIDKGSARLCLI